MPRAEGMLWEQLRGKRLGEHRFRRQVSIGKYVVDFYCPRLRLVVEVDGESHFQEGAREYDWERQQIIENLGLHFIRVTNTDVYSNLQGVVDEILHEMKRIENRRISFPK